MFDWLAMYFIGLFSLDVMVYPVVAMTFSALFALVYDVILGSDFD